jgi:NAD(P)-dependent dehydrogenase (short-subunit alcohol dehydrogenase family)
VGEAVARAFAMEGARLIVLARDDSDAEARAAELRTTGARVDAFGVDLTDAARLERTAAAVRSVAPGGLDALVHVAGGFAMSGPVAESDPAVSHRQIAINLTTAYLTTRAFLPLVRDRHGAIVYFVSVDALPGGSPAGKAAYAAAKSGVLALMRAVAAEEHEHGVRANAVAPSAVRTATNVGAMGEDARYVEREEAAEAVMFLCSATAVNGQVMVLSPR